MTITDFISNAPLAKVFVVFVLFPLLTFIIGYVYPRNDE